MDTLAQKGRHVETLEVPGNRSQPQEPDILGTNNQTGTKVRGGGICPPPRTTLFEEPRPPGLFYFVIIIAGWRRRGRMAPPGFKLAAAAAAKSVPSQFDQCRLSVGPRRPGLRSGGAAGRDARGRNALRWADGTETLSGQPLQPLMEG